MTNDADAGLPAHSRRPGAKPPAGIPVDADFSEYITFWIVEDDTRFRETVVEILNDEEKILCTGSFDDCESLLKRLEDDVPPTVMLVDIRIPDKMSGTECVRTIRGYGYNTPVIMVTQMDTKKDVQEALHVAKATSYLVKPVRFNELLDAVRLAAEGRTVLSPGILDKALDRPPIPPAAHNRYGLTPREMEVLYLLAEGLSKKEIGKRLFIEFCTVDTHLRHIYAKLGVRSRGEAVAKAYREGLIRPRTDEE